MRTICSSISIAAVLGIASICPAQAPAKNRPVDDIGQAAVFTVNEFIDTDRGIELARQVPSDVLIRGWFKWGKAHDFSKMAHLPAKAHELGALFGGGVTCSALYHGENGLTEAQVLDMATRGPSGELVDAWKLKNVRHGTLSNPKYVDYVLSWCFKQIDAGTDYLFMDEIDAALHRNEGFDDYSLKDFRQYLIGLHCADQKWTPADARWGEKYKIDLKDKAIAADGTINTFDYRAYLKSLDLTADPLAPKNPMAPAWYKFRAWRDDRAWERMTAEIRAYGKSKGRKVHISGNGLASGVDLQVLGVWGLWVAKDGKIELSGNGIPDWAALVRAGHAKAGKKVPVVVFHDWGTTGFPYQQVSTAQRNLWNRIRGAEVYAAGAFYAFPVHGPYGCDAAKDGTLQEIARQAAFYRRNKALYLEGEMRGSDCVAPADPLLSASLWTHRSGKTVMVHVVNRKVVDGKIEARRHVTIQIPTKDLPKSVTVVSPDFEGARQGSVERAESGSRLMVPDLEAYAVAVLEYEGPPKLEIVPDRLLLPKHWSRPAVSEFKVGRFGAIENAGELHGVLQGRLHGHMANPPTFVVNAKSGAKLAVNVQAVSTAGGRLEIVVDGKVVKREEIADRDGKNDTSVGEMDVTIEVEIPMGEHRVTVQNTGKDWVSLRWLRFSGELGD